MWLFNPFVGMAWRMCRLACRRANVYSHRCGRSGVSLSVCRVRLGRWQVGQKHLLRFKLGQATATVPDAQWREISACPADVLMWALDYLERLKLNTVEGRAWRQRFATELLPSAR